MRFASVLFPLPLAPQMPTMIMIYHSYNNAVVNTVVFGSDQISVCYLSVYHEIEVIGNVGRGLARLCSSLVSANKLREFVVLE